MRRALAILATVLAASACSDPPRTITTPEESSRFSGAAAPQACNRREAEAVSFDVAVRVREFGGYVTASEGASILFITRGANAERARSELQRQLALHGGESPTTAGLRTVEAEHSFLQLCAWRDAIFTNLLHMPGVVHSGIAEELNRVRVGTVDAAAEGRARGELARLGIPSSAVEFRRSPKIVPHQLTIYAPFAQSTPFNEWHLQGYWRPLEGGIQIGFRRMGMAPDSSSACTLGFNAILNNGSPVVLTNSHCSERMWDLDNMHYFQPRHGVDRFIGYEYRDPNASSCGFLSVNVCRDADVSAMYVQPGVPTNRGYLVRPTNRVQGPWLYGSLWINSSDPKLTITNRQSWAVANQQVDKIGRTSGWTYGSVAYPCEDLNVPNRSFSKLRCQAITTYTSRPGDSGSPVFRYFGGSSVTLVGINWGGCTDGSCGVFSPLGGIEKDMGGLNVLAPGFEPPPPPPPPPCEPVPGQIDCVV